MIAWGRAATVTALVGAIGCASMPPARPGKPKLPREIALVDEPRMDPMERLRQFDLRFRDIEIQYSGRLGGLASLQYPLTAQPDAPYVYILLGRDLVAAGDLSAASRAYWAALALTGKTLTSRRDRERLRSVAYGELARLAIGRGQPLWGEMLVLLASLADIFVASEQAEAEQRAFAAEVSRFESALRKARIAREGAEKEADNAALMSVLSGLQAINTGSPPSAAQIAEATGRVIAEQIIIADDREDVREEFDEALTKVGAGADAFRGVVVDDLNEIAAGKSFLVASVAYYLTTAAPPDRARYMSALERFARDKPRIAAVLASSSRNTPEALSAALGEFEVFVATYERRGKDPAQVTRPGSAAKEPTAPAATAPRVRPAVPARDGTPVAPSRAAAPSPVRPQAPTPAERPTRETKQPDLYNSR